MAMRTGLYERHVHRNGYERAMRWPCHFCGAPRPRGPN